MKDISDADEHKGVVETIADGTNLLIAVVVLAVCLGIGIVGYHVFADLGWIDSLHNAAMILSGMGPVNIIRTVRGKVFASSYAIFSGVAFISTIGIILAPSVHGWLQSLKQLGKARRPL